MLKRKPRGGAYAWMLLAAVSAGASEAASPSRVVSLNLCTDQLLLALADRSQIAALNRWARDPKMSFLAGSTRNVPTIRGAAEEVLHLQPDLVLGGTFSSTATIVMLKQQGLHVETFSPPTTIDAAKAEITRAAELLGQVSRGASLIANIDRALAMANPAPGPRPTALALQRRGYVSGRETLIADVMRRVGLANAADALGMRWVEHVSLEMVAKTRPDLLILEASGSEAPDQATALLRHPVLAGLPFRRVVVPFTEQDCAGPALPALIGRLATAARSVSGRW